MDFTLIFDWLGREGGYLVSWWLLVTLAGAAAWPLLFRFMGGLPDRGYTLARTAGLMLTGFVYWFMASLGLLRNAPGGMVIAWLIVLAAGVIAIVRWNERPMLRFWFRENWVLILAVEVLFILLFLGLAIYRAHNPEMGDTEKPMEIMFLNSIRRSEIFPPNDAWLAGHSISYYYFGYVIMAMLADLSRIDSSIAFNLMLALIFALTGIGVLGVVYNMVRLRGTRFAAILSGLLGVAFLLMMGNLGTALVEFPYQGYAPEIASAEYFDFWDIGDREGEIVTVNADGQEIVIFPDRDNDGIPNWDDEALDFRYWSFWQFGQYDNAFGWTYSRVVHDRHLNGEPEGAQPITETPVFSFVLSDIHPHVSAMPFALLAIGLSLNLVLGKRDLWWYEYPLYAICVGGMIFLNSWDGVYLALLIGADVLRRWLRRRGALTFEDGWRAALFAAIMIGLTLILYLPWLITFSSQASGILPNVVYPTPWQQFFLQFGAFLIILTVYLLVEATRGHFNVSAALMVLVSVIILVGAILVVLGARAWDDPLLRGTIYKAVNGNSLSDILPDIRNRRLSGLPSELLLLALIFIVIGRIFSKPASDPDEVLRVTYSPATGFALLLIGMGAALTFLPDFVYLHDNFGVRINTVFKLYYQGWIIFSVAGAFAVWSIMAGNTERRTKPNPIWIAPRAVFLVGVLILLIAGMSYGVLAGRGRAFVNAGRLCEGKLCPNQRDLTLDGVPTMVSSDDYDAIQCLDRLEPTDDDIVVVEAPGRAYTPSYSRFSGLTGIPTLIGWEGHEGQWRGTTYPEVTDQRMENGRLRSRISDVQDMYTTQDWDEAWSVIDRYGIDYIVIGGAERDMISRLAGVDPGLMDQYTQGLDKFQQVLEPVCQYGGTVVYRVSPS